MLCGNKNADAKAQSGKETQSKEQKRRLQAWLCAFLFAKLCVLCAFASKSFFLPHMSYELRLQIRQKSKISDRSGAMLGCIELGDF